MKWTNKKRFAILKESVFGRVGGRLVECQNGRRVKGKSSKRYAVKRRRRKEER